MSEDFEGVKKNITTIVLEVLNDPDLWREYRTALATWGDEQENLPLTLDTDERPYCKYNMDALKAYFAENYLNIIQPGGLSSDLDMLWEDVMHRVFYQAINSEEDKQCLINAYPELVAFEKKLHTSAWDAFGLGCKYPDFHEVAAKELPEIFKRWADKTNGSNAFSYIFPLALASGNDNLMAAAKPFFQSAVDSASSMGSFKIPVLSRVVRSGLEAGLGDEEVSPALSALIGSISAHAKEKKLKSSASLFCNPDVIAMLNYGETEIEDLQKLQANYSGVSLVISSNINASDGFDNKYHNNILVTLNTDEETPFFVVVQQYNKYEFDKADFYELRPEEKTIRYFHLNDTLLPYREQVFTLLDEHAQKFKDDPRIDMLVKDTKKMLEVAKPYHDLVSASRWMEGLQETYNSSAILMDNYREGYEGFMTAKASLEEMGVSVDSLMEKLVGYPVPPAVKRETLTLKSR